MLPQTTTPSFANTSPSNAHLTGSGSAVALPRTVAPLTTTTNHVIVRVYDNGNLFKALDFSPTNTVYDIISIYAKKKNIDSNVVKNLSMWYYRGQKMGTKLESSFVPYELVSKTQNIQNINFRIVEGDGESLCFKKNND